MLYKINGDLSMEAARFIPKHLPFGPLSKYISLISLTGAAPLVARWSCFPLTQYIMPYHGISDCFAHLSLSIVGDICNWSQYLLHYSACQAPWLHPSCLFMAQKYSEIEFVQGPEETRSCVMTLGQILPYIHNEVQTMWSIIMPSYCLFTHH